MQSVPQILPTAQQPHILNFRVPFWDGSKGQRQVLAGVIAEGEALQNQRHPHELHPGRGLCRNELFRHQTPADDLVEVPDRYKCVLTCALLAAGDQLQGRDAPSVVDLHH